MKLDPNSRIRNLRYRQALFQNRDFETSLLASERVTPIS